MSLSPGANIGPYEILDRLGSGGMGEVYRAKDTRLKREAALKVLPGEFVENDDRLKRFEREARAASALNHPNIITIYDIASVDSHTYIAMELVDGKTLRQILNSGPLPLRKTLSIAAQFADGLAKAHSGGIVHRDLKPENLMITKEGFAKILDFGLAKLALPGSKEASTALTKSDTQTQAGTLLGTVAYMSPEQAAGESVDFRSDQFSFGTILYEMITGKHPFRRKTAAETLSAILNEEPEAINSLSAQTPTPVTWIVERCMAKDPADRYESTRDLAKEIHMLRDRISRSESSAALLPAKQKIRFSNIWNLTAAVLLLLLATTTALLYRKSFQSAKPLFYHRLTYRRGYIPSAKFSQDGQTIVYSGAFQESPNELFMTRMQGAESRPLGIQNAQILSISKSGEMAILLQNPISWSAEGVLARVPLTGGAPREIADHVWGAAWTPDGSKLAVTRRISGRTRLELPLGKMMYESAGYLHDIRFSPDGSLISFHENPWPSLVGSVTIMDLQGKKLASLNGLYPTGSAWRTTRELWISCLTNTGGVGTELYGLTSSGKQRLIQRFPSAILHDITEADQLLITSDDTRSNTIGWFHGKKRDLSVFDGSVIGDISNDGNAVLLAEVGEATDSGAVYLRKIDDSSAIRLGEAGFARSLSRDGKYALAYKPEKSNPRLILFPTGAGETRSFNIKEYMDDDRYAHAMLFPDGTRILFFGKEKGHAPRAYVQDVSGGRPRAITEEGVTCPVDKVWPCPISPDGNAFIATNTDNKICIYSMDQRQPIKVSGILEEEMPFQWSKDGKSIYVVNPNVFPVKIFRLDPFNGQRTLVNIWMPPDPAGVLGLDGVRLTPDEQTFVYSYTVVSSTLYLLDGLK